MTNIENVKKFLRNFGLVKVLGEITEGFELQLGGTRFVLPREDVDMYQTVQANAILEPETTFYIPNYYEHYLHLIDESSYYNGLSHAEEKLRDICLVNQDETIRIEISNISNLFVLEGVWKEMTVCGIIECTTYSCRSIIACTSAMPYQTDLTDEQWALIAPIVTFQSAEDRYKGGRPRTVDLRRIVDALLYQARTGCQWRLLYDWSQNLDHMRSKRDLLGSAQRMWREHGEATAAAECTIQISGGDRGA
jgi:hypothetical protein